MCPVSRMSSPVEVSRWASRSLSPKGTPVTTRLMRTMWGMAGPLPAFSARILRASSNHSSLKNGYGMGVAPLSSACPGCTGAPTPPGNLVAAGTIVASPVACPGVTAPILPGAEPFSTTGDGRGALVLHGFTGNPQSMRGLALALADAGLTVELPLLPGHGTDVADMVPTRWADWAAAADAAYAELASRCESVVVVGLSMGGTLSLWLGERHPEI